MLNLTKEQIDALLKEGYRPFEIYVANKTKVEYMGKTMPPNTVMGWNIECVFSTREKLKSLPFFDEVIGVDCIANCETVWHGESI